MPRPRPASQIVAGVIQQESANLRSRHTRRHELLTRSGSPVPWPGGGGRLSRRGVRGRACGSGLSGARLGIVPLCCGSHTERYPSASDEHHRSASCYSLAFHLASHAPTAAGAPCSPATRISAAIHSRNNDRCRYRVPGLLRVLARMAPPLATSTKMITLVLIPLALTPARARPDQVQRRGVSQLMPY